MGISVLVAGDVAFREGIAAALGSGYSLIEADTANAAAEALLAAKPVLAVVDLRGASGPGDAICRRIKGAASTRLLPVVACADPGEDNTVAALDAGADHALGFPPPRAELHARIRSALRNRVATERLEDASQVIFALANAVEAKDAYTEGHTERVGALAVEAGRLAGLDGETCEALRQGGVLHDIGKIGIPNEIINKAGRLTDKERIVMNKHPIIGERICEPLKSLRHLLPIIRGTQNGKTLKALTQQFGRTSVVGPNSVMGFLELSRKYTIIPSPGLVMSGCWPPTGSAVATAQTRRMLRRCWRERGLT